jgi:hypothetical protein
VEKEGENSVLLRRAFFEFHEFGGIDVFGRGGDAAGMA